MAIYKCLLLLVSKPRDIDLKQTVGAYEFSIAPRALFAADGSLLHSTSKSDLTLILENLLQKKEVPQEDNNKSHHQVDPGKCVTSVECNGLSPNTRQTRVAPNRS